MSKRVNVGQHLFRMTKPHSRPQNHITHTQTLCFLSWWRDGYVYNNLDAIEYI